MSTVEWFFALLGVGLAVTPIGAQGLGYDLPRPIAKLLFFGGLTCIAGAFVFPVYRHFRPAPKEEAAHGYVGTIFPSASPGPNEYLEEIFARDLGIPFESLGQFMRRMEVGNSEVHFWFPIKANDLKSPSQLPLPLDTFFNDMSLRIEGPNDHLQVSATFYDKDGHIEATLTNNSLTVFQPKTFKVGHGDNDLEVINDRNRVVLQIRLFSDHFELQGESWNEDGYGMRIVKMHTAPNTIIGAGFVPLRPDHDPREPHIEPIFDYSMPVPTLREDLTGYDASMPSPDWGPVFPSLSPSDFRNWNPRGKKILFLVSGLYSASDERIVPVAPMYPYGPMYTGFPYTRASSKSVNWFVRLSFLALSAAMVFIIPLSLSVAGFAVVLFRHFRRDV